ncbi:nucleoside-diphosphate kinase [Streptomyces polygonati]|uniref:nucleoside-diphosphate kinase n=1 Tax=Streptomyces polygonati TaxID=1617087 RepID=A0ABV8HUY8_9ACTN
MAKDSEQTEQPVERTLVLLKPDAVVRGFAGKIIARFEDAALKIVGVKMKQMDADFTRRHYFDLEERLGREVYDFTATFMQQGPVIALVLEGFDAVATVRKIVGSTYPNEAPAGTVRGDFSHYSKAASVVAGKAVANLVHASGNRDEAAQEIDLWFDKDELYAYRTLAEIYTY